MTPVKQPSEAKERHIRAGNTDPVELTIGASGLSNLDDLNAGSSEIYIREEGKRTNHVDAGSITIKSSANRTIEFDPVGAKVGGGDALDTPGRFVPVVKLVWSDGRVTWHPDEHEDPEVWVVGPNFET